MNWQMKGGKVIILCDEALQVNSGNLGHLSSSVFISCSRGSRGLMDRALDL